MIDNSKEYVLCAAIWYQDGTEALKGMIAQNIDSGVVIGQWRHGNCINVRATNRLWNKKMLKDRLERDSDDIPMRISDEKPDVEYSYVDGFITSEGRFVDRWQGMELALLAGQVDEESAINKNWGGDEEYMKDFQKQTPHYRGGEERNKCKYRMMYSEDLY